MFGVVRLITKDLWPPRLRDIFLCSLAGLSTFFIFAIGGGGGFGVGGGAGGSGALKHISSIKD